MFFYGIVQPDSKAWRDCKDPEHLIISPKPDTLTRPSLYDVLIREPLEGEHCSEDGKGILLKSGWKTGMGLYSAYIFPHLMDRVMSRPGFQRLRSETLQSAQGEVLEIGLGTGLNLPHYSAGVSRLRAVDPVPLLPERVATRLAAVPFPVEIMHLSAERLPYDEGVFDCVVSTWTLCTIPDSLQALREIRRVLKPAGRFLFLEHGRSENARTAAWQDRLNPIQQVIGCGCNLNRRIDQLIGQAGLDIVQLDRLVMEGVPRIAGELYRGIATPDRTGINLQPETDGRGATRSSAPPR